MPEQYADYMVCAVWVFLGAAFAMYGFELLTLSKLQRHGKKTQGKVTHKSKRRYKNTVESYIEVEFSTGLRTIDGKYKVPEDVWDTIAVGANVPVIYLEEKPKKCHHPDHVGETWNMLAVKGLFFLAVLGIMIVITVQQKIDPEGNWLKSITGQQESEEE